MTKLLPSIIAVAVALVGAFEGPIQSFVTGHPAIAAAIAAIGVILAHLAPQPQK